MSLDKLLSGVSTLAIVCNQWGDTGKGKFVDFFAEWADIIARGTGGANAGHTIKIGNEEFIFHLIPSGILYDDLGKINVIGRGVAFYPNVALEEMEILDKYHKSYEGLKIAYNANLLLPQHIVMDRVKEKVKAKAAGKMIGTTGRGIGPCYVDVPDRVGMFVNDMLNKDVFARKIKSNLQDKVRMLKQLRSEWLEAEIMSVFSDEKLGLAKYYDKAEFFNADAIIETYMQYGKHLATYITDTDELLRSSVGMSKILLEGAQGLLLSMDYGSYPYVTSSDCSIRGLAKGVGLKEKDVDLTLGICKAFYITRVGEGPFPTELGGEKSADWCRNKTRADEKKDYPNASMNDADEFVQGVAVRREGREYGATTGRPRRTGWFDLPIHRYATQINGDDLILTKIDVLTGCDTIKVCTAYEYDGPDYNLGSEVIRKGDTLDTAIMDIDVMKHCKPVYVEMPGWTEDLSGIRRYSHLPKQVKNLVKMLGEDNVKIISVGPDREQNIFM
jgi:adenylosuccinate synthase